MILAAVVGVCQCEFEPRVTGDSHLGAQQQARVSFQPFDSPPIDRVADAQGVRQPPTSFEAGSPDGFVPESADFPGQGPGVPPVGPADALYHGPHLGGRETGDRRRPFIGEDAPARPLRIIGQRLGSLVEPSCIGIPVRIYGAFDFTT